MSDNNIVDAVLNVLSNSDNSKLRIVLDNEDDMDALFTELPTSNTINKALLHLNDGSILLLTLEEE